jgi:hypothetical protein
MWQRGNGKRIELSSRPQAIRLLGEGAVSAPALTEDGLPQYVLLKVFL